MHKSEQSTPALRFPEFNDVWKKDKLEKFATIKTGSRDTQNRIDDGEYPFFVRSDTIERIDTFALDKEAVLTSGDGVGVGKNIHYINGKFDYHQRVYAIYDYVQNLNAKFFYQFFKENFLRRVMRLSAKNSVDSVRMSMITDMLVPLPSVTEQQKIAEFLSTVDDKIAQLQKKKDLLQEYKKGCMQKLFSQELRFKDDKGNPFPDWEEMKLAELELYISDGNYGEMYPKANQMLEAGVPFIRANNLKNGTVTWDDMKYVSPQLHSVLTSGHLKQGDILVTTRGDIGTLSYVPEDFEGANINAQICLLRTQNKNSSKYLFYYLSLESSYRQFKSLQTGSALKQLPKGNLNKIRVHIPAPNEQKKISDFLSAIDDKIVLVSEELNKAKTFKKGLLQKMFV